MDRFIEGLFNPAPKFDWDLKSNMDRFIGKNIVNIPRQAEDLKSNMDRFIAINYRRYKNRWNI